VPSRRIAPRTRATLLVATTTTALALALALAGCGSDDRASTASADAAAKTAVAAYPVTVENCGRTETFDAAPERAVAVNQPAIELMLSLGLQDRMVGTASWSDAVLPTLAAANAKVPRLSSNFPSFERTLKAEPDFVYSTFNYTFTAEGIATRDRFEKLGVRTYQAVAECEGQEATQSRPQTMQDTYDEIGDIARIFGVRDRGDALIATLEARMAKAAGGLDAGDVSLAWWYSATKSPYMAGCCGAAGIVTKAVGAKNAFADNKQLFPEIGWEAILDRDPTVLVLADLTRGDEGDSAAEKIEFLESDPVARRLTAVRNKRYVIVTGSEMDQSIRNVDATEKVAKGLRDLKLVG
jgi:iron complex transport system substrate-binding protein